MFAIFFRDLFEESIFFVQKKKTHVERITICTYVWIGILAHFHWKFDGIIYYVSCTAAFFLIIIRSIINRVFIFYSVWNMLKQCKENVWKHLECAVIIVAQTIFRMILVQKLLGSKNYLQFNFALNGSKCKLKRGNFYQLKEKKCMNLVGSSCVHLLIICQWIIAPNFVCDE